MLSLQRTKQAVIRALRAVHAAALIASLVISSFVSPEAHALQIRLGSGMNVRTIAEGGLDKVGMLAAGSVVEIPDQFKVLVRGKVDGTASFNNWLTQAGYAQGDIKKKVRDPKFDFYFPVRIVSMARGSTGGRKLIGKTQFMALRVLARSRGKLSVVEKAPYYTARTDAAPVQPIDPYEVAQPADEDANEEVAAPASPITAPADSAQEAAATCENCEETEPVSPAPSSAADLSEVVEEFESTTIPSAFDEALSSGRLQSLTPGFFAGGARCEKFISEDGQSYGPYGQEVLKQISQEEDVYLSNSNGAASKEFCPRFASFSKEQKRHYWVWLFAALAWQESKCGSDKRTGYANPNGGSVGMFHIEANPVLRRTRDRGFGGNYCSGDPKSMRVNVRCSVRMMMTPLSQGLGPFSKRDQYWGPMKFSEGGSWIKLKSGKKIFVKSTTKKLAKQFKACGVEKN